MEQQMPTLINTRFLLIIHEDLLEMGVLPEEGRKNTLKMITMCQKEIAAFIIQKQLKKFKNN